MTADTPVDELKDAPLCADCQEPIQRIARTRFMRALVGSKHYLCRYFRQRYLSLLGFVFPIQR